LAQQHQRHPDRSHLGRLTPGPCPGSTQAGHCASRRSGAGVSLGSPFSCPAPRTIFPHDSAEIRRKFLEFFKARGHQEVPSSPLVPADDPRSSSPMPGWCSSSEYFRGSSGGRTPGRDVPEVRAGGRQAQRLEQVGHTTRHHTFFEMLGNFRSETTSRKRPSNTPGSW